MAIIVNQINLNGITADAEGVKVFVGGCHNETIFVEVTGGTVAGTITIQSSPDGTLWIQEWQKTYSAADTDMIKLTTTHRPYLRTILTSRTNGTFKTWITGGP